MRLCFFLLFYGAMGFAQTPFVTNINTQQEGDKIIITYDLGGKSKDRYDITLVRIEVINFPKGIVPKSLTGDVGKNIPAGKNKTIVWDALKDVESLDGDIKVVIMANQTQISPKNNKLLVHLGASVIGVGGGAFFIFGLNNLKEGQTMYNNYAATTDPTKFQQDYGTTRSDALASSKTTYSKGRIFSIAGGTMIAVSSFLWVKQILKKKIQEPRLGFVPTSNNNIGLVYRF